MTAALLAAIITPSIAVPVIIIALSTALTKAKKNPILEEFPPIPEQHEPNPDLIPAPRQHPILQINPAHHQLRQIYSRLLRQKQQFEPRVNTLLNRISTGKYNNAPLFTPTRRKTTGCAPGAFFTKAHTNPYPKQEPLKDWIGKFGLNQNAQKINLRDSITARSAMILGIHADAFLEKISNDAYLYLSNRQFIVPKSRLMLTPIINTFTQDNQFIPVIQEELNLLARPETIAQNQGERPRFTEAVHVFSKLVPNYQDLSELMVPNENNEPISMKDYVDNFKKIPSNAIINGETIPIKGLLALLASSILLADTDALGGRFTNAGFVPVTKNGRLAYVKVVKIDPGFAFNFEGAENRFFQSFNDQAQYVLENKHDIQIGNNTTTIIKWSNLSQYEQDQFVIHLKLGLQSLEQRENKLRLFYRDGFNQVCDTVQLSPNFFDNIIESFTRHLNRIQTVFQAELDSISTIVQPNNPE
jgi:hypothetical protein